MGVGMENTHEKIIAAARELFEKNGFAAATTREIAELAGVSEVTLFRHFSTKRALFEETLHSCIHPYKVDEYLENGVTYDLEIDLKSIAYNMMETYRNNAPLIRMIMRDKIRESAPEMDYKKKQHGAESRLHEYFATMHRMGRLGADPEMALKFYLSNITGYFMRNLFAPSKCAEDKKYFDWMLGAIISMLKPQ
jgi:TetR/AcrR family transcriptional regulator, mexJK operon transcriptional repressor